MKKQKKIKNIKKQRMIFILIILIMIIGFISVLFNINDNDESEFCKYINLLLESDGGESTNEINRDENQRSLLHYDDIFISDKNGLSNRFFIDFIESDRLNNLDPSLKFTDLAKNKILGLTAIRVWIEYKLAFATHNKLTGTLGHKLNSFLKKNYRDIFPNLTKEGLMSKKVMLNQNCHVKSQKTPFYFALSLTIDEIRSEISEIREMFS